MIYPSIDKILNIVDSKYALVYIVKAAEHAGDESTYRIDANGVGRRACAL